MRHLISINDLLEDELKNLLDVSDDIEANPQKYRSVMDQKVLTNLFYEPSTRTSSSFHSAMLRLGGSVIQINEVQYSSVSKGENLQDTILTIGSYSDFIVLRSQYAGDAKIASEASQVPVINAGDGAGEHPTQSLLDLRTIYKNKGALEGMKIVFVGDIANGRTVHSLGSYLQNNNECHYFESYEDMTSELSDADVLYMTRVQTERGSTESYELTRDHVDVLSKECIVMHPFPRNDELPRWFDLDPRAKYIEQMKHGLFMRMAILTTLE